MLVIEGWRCAQLC